MSAFESLSVEIAYPTTQRCSSGTPIEGKIEGTLPCMSLKIEMSVGEPSSAVCAVEGCLLWKQRFWYSELAHWELGVLSKKVQGNPK